MGVILKDWRKHEESIDDIIEKYPDVSRFTILKTDLHRRGYTLSEAAREKLDPKIHHTSTRGLFAQKDNDPVGLTLRDGTGIIGSFAANDVVPLREPYLLDVADGKLVLTDQGKIYEEAEYWYKPKYFDKLTSKGTPMWQVLSARFQRLEVTLSHSCQFWNIPGGGCKYCSMGAIGAAERKKGCPLFADVDDIAETVKEAVKKPGRFAIFHATSGSILSGEKLLEDELNQYILVLKSLVPFLKTNKLRGHINSTAFNRNQLERLKKETGLDNYTSDIEVLGEDLFNWICPGKAMIIGYQEWKHRLFDAAEIFGKGHVTTDIVNGVELVKPYGYNTEDEALKHLLEEAEDFAKHNVAVVNIVWNVVPNSIFRDQVSPSLDYYIRVSRGLARIYRTYGLQVYMDDYRRCGNHASTDLTRN